MRNPLRYLIVAGALALSCAPAQSGLIGTLDASAKTEPAAVELGKMLFFDTRLSGDGSLSCASCHDPKKGFTDGLALSAAYPGSKYFRNTKTVVNVQYARYLYWDGRLSGGDLPTMVRDHITETHFMNLDGRLMLERLKQIPEYDQRFKKTMGGEPSFGRTLNAITAYLKSLRSKNVPFDNGTLSAAAKRGRALFVGRAGCAECHSGSMFTDYDAHLIDVPDHPEILADAERHFTMRAFFKFMGTPNFENMRRDVGYYAVTKEEKDRYKFVTPTLRELTHTAPYMHNGTLATLEQVVALKNKGGAELKPLALTAAQQADLVAFLKSLSGDAPNVTPPALPAYAAIADWPSKEN